METNNIQPMYAFEELYLIHRNGFIVPMNDSIADPVYSTEGDKQYVIIKDKNGNSMRFLVNTLVKKTFQIKPLLKKDRHVEGNQIEVIGPDGSKAVFTNILQVSQCFNIEIKHIEHCLKFKNLPFNHLIFRSVPVASDVDPSSFPHSNPDDFKHF